MSWVNLSGEAANYFPELQGGALLNVPPAHELFSRAPISFEQALDAADAGTPLSTPLGTEITLSRKTDHESITSPNIIGILRGSDPQLADEFVVLPRTSITSVWVCRSTGTAYTTVCTTMRWVRRY